MPLRLGVIAGIVGLSVLAGTISSYAYWSVTANATLGVEAATLSSSATGFSSETFGNADIASTGSISLTSTGSITFTNTTDTDSTQSQTLTVTFSRASGDTTLASQTTLTTWHVASAASCTPAATPVSPVSGTWSAGVVVSRTLAVGASATYCLRNTIADRQDVADNDGTRSFVPQAAAQLSIGNFVDTETTPSNVSTEYIYTLDSISAGVYNYVKRAGTEWCWDVSGNDTGSPSTMISWTCKNDGSTNQDWRFMDADADGYGDFQPGHTSALRVAAAASTTSGSLVNMLTANTSSPTQQWQPQLVSSSPETYQFVNKYSGLCISMPAVSAGVASQVTCSGGPDQRFTLSQRSVVQLTSQDCQNVGSNQNRTVEYSWTVDYATGGPYTINAREDGSSPWVTIATATTTGNSVTVSSPIGSPLTDWGWDTYDVQILNVDSQQVGTDAIRVRWHGGWDGYFYARC